MVSGGGGCIAAQDPEFESPDTLATLYGITTEWPKIIHMLP